MANDPIWRKQEVLGKVVDILSSQRNRRDKVGQFGYPFLTSYQIAILLDAKYPEIRRELGMRLGGGQEQGDPDQDSLAHYLATQLSRVSRNDRGCKVEKALLSGDRCKISFNTGERVFESAVYPLSMFRYRP